MSLLPVSNYTAAIVVIGSVWSGLRTRRYGVLLIAVGVVAAGASFVFVRIGQGELVSVFLAIGVSLMYGGFVAAGRPSKRRAFTRPSPSRV
jgi:predicted phage tail protein